ncbi:MAG: protein kinase [Acidobacteria bacterium]|nr:protein kinase [Acidobacteriota bacterium]
MIPRVAAIVLSLSVVAAPTALALDPGRAVTQYMRDFWDSRSGLPNDTVNTILQTRDGYVWIGTQAGLARFDGVRFTNFTKANTPALRSDTINTLFEDREGTLWVGTGDGLVSVSGAASRTWRARDDLVKGSIFSICQSNDGSLWVGTSAGLGHLKDGEILACGKCRKIGQEWIRALSAGADGSIWIGTSGKGLYRLREGELHWYGKDDKTIPGAVRAIGEDRAGTVWIGTRTGVRALQDNHFTAYTSREGLSHDLVASVFGDRDGNVWMGTQGGGLNRLRDGRFEKLTTREGLSNDVVSSIIEDQEGNLWIGTAGGLERMRDSPVATYSWREGLAGEFAWSVYEDREGALWIGTLGGGLSRFQNGIFTTYTHSDGLPDNSVASLCEARDGKLWIGTNLGLGCRESNGRFLSYTDKNGLPRQPVRPILEDREGDLWVGTRGGGLSRLANGRFTTYTTKDGLPSDEIWALLLEKDGSLLIGTSDGIARLQDGRFTVLNDTGSVMSLSEDHDGCVWIATDGDGLGRLKDGKLTNYTTEVGLPGDTLAQVLDDDAGNLWLSSDRGIFSIRKKEFDDLDRGAIRTIHYTAYGKAEGMRSASCVTGSSPAGCRTKDGRLWFPTTAGVAMIDPNKLRTNPLPPPVYIEDVLVDGRSLGIAEGLEIAPGRVRLEIQYTALSFVDPQKVKFRYKLEGFDKDWVDVSTMRTAYFTNLPPGHYTFHVRACNNDGVWNEAGARLGFTLKPFFYQTRGFQLLSAIGLVAAGAGAQLLRIRRLKARERELQRIVQEQTRDLRAANEELRRIQEQLARLSESTPEKIENISGWGAAMADEIAGAIHAHQIGIWRADGKRLVAISGTTKAPSWEAVRAAPWLLEDLAGGPAGGETIVPVNGMTGELRGALVIDGPVVWGELERRLVTGFVQHLGSALELQHLREQLTVTEARQAAVRQKMRESGVHTLMLCPQCRRCYDETTDACAEDGTRLEASRLLPYRISGRYRLTFLLGEGGMGSVFSAHDEKLRRDVALKVIKAELLNDPEVRFRLEREARALAQVHHPSVIALFDSGELDDGSAFLVMELLAGRDLADLLKTSGPGSPRQVALLLRQAGAALGAAHRAGVIHRDIKPANIFLVPVKGSFQTKLLDFGLAKSLGSDARLTQTGMMIGTPMFMSPEQIQGFDVDARSDLYSLAAVVYEALAGRRVVPGNDVGRILLDVLHATPPRISSLVPGLGVGVDEAFESALAKRPSDRPRDVEAWADGLALLLDAVQTSIPGWPLGSLEVIRAKGAGIEGQTTRQAPF